MLDAAQSTLIWSHGEQGAAGPEAVYRYAIPAEKSHYEVEYGCIRGLAPQIPGPHVPQFSAYLGRDHRGPSERDDPSPDSESIPEADRSVCRRRHRRGIRSSGDWGQDLYLPGEERRPFAGGELRITREFSGTPANIAE